MEFGLRLIGWELYSTQKFSLTAEYAEVCPKRFGATVQRAVGFAKLGGQSGVGENWADPNGMGPGAGCEAPTVQWAAPTMVGRSFGHDLAGGQSPPNQLTNWHNLVQSGPKGGRGFSGPSAHFVDPTGIQNLKATAWPAKFVGPSWELYVLCVVCRAA